MLKFILTGILLAVFCAPAFADVRYNPVTRVWEGNICMSSYGWAVVQYQPLGSLCAFKASNNRIYQGVIINQ